MGERSRSEASGMIRLIGQNNLSWLSYVLRRLLFEELCGDDLMASAALSIGHIDSICT